MEASTAMLFVFTAFLAGLSATIPPGPIFAMVVAESSRRGFAAGLSVVIGHAIVEVFVVFALALGLSVFLGSRFAIITISIIGGLTLIWMAYRLVGGTIKKTESKPEVDGEGVRYSPAIYGLVAAVANPYFMLWWMTVGGAFIIQGIELLGIVGPLVFLICHWASDFPWFGFISYSFSKGRKFLSDKAYRTIIILCGVFLLGLGVMFVVDGLKMVIG